MADQPEAYELPESLRKLTKSFEAIPERFHHADGVVLDMPADSTITPGVVWVVSAGGIENEMIGVFASVALGKERARKSIRLAGSPDAWVWTKSLRQWRTTDHRWFVTEFQLEGDTGAATAKALEQALEAMRLLYTNVERSTPRGGETHYALDAMDNARLAIAAAERALFPVRTVEVRDDQSE